MNPLNAEPEGHCYNDSSLQLQENTKIHQENMRLVKAVAKGTQGAEREVLQELITSNERLQAEKEQVPHPA